MELIVKFIFSEDWDNDYKDIDAELIAEDAIRELAEGVGYEIINLKRGAEKGSNENAALTLHDVSNLAKFCKEISQQEDCPAEFTEIVNKEFWNLI